MNFDGCRPGVCFIAPRFIHRPAVGLSEEKIMWAQTKLELLRDSPHENVKRGPRSHSRQFAT